MEIITFKFSVENLKSYSRTHSRRNVTWGVTRMLTRESQELCPDVFVQQYDVGHTALLLKIAADCKQSFLAAMWRNELDADREFFSISLNHA